MLDTPSRLNGGTLRARIFDRRTRARHGKIGAWCVVRGGVKRGCRSAGWRSVGAQLPVASGMVAECGGRYKREGWIWERPTGRVVSELNRLDGCARRGKRGAPAGECLVHRRFGAPQP